MVYALLFRSFLSGCKREERGSQFADELWKRDGLENPERGVEEEECDK
jgi:hypothetical protein